MIVSDGRMHYSMLVKKSSYFLKLDRVEKLEKEEGALLRLLYVCACSQFSSFSDSFSSLLHFICLTRLKIAFFFFFLSSHNDYVIV